MKKVLVTGGAGFLGSHLVEQLLEQGADVVAIDNLFRGTMSNLETVVGNPRFSFIDGDILDERLLREAVNGCDIIFHLAAINGTKYFYDAPKLVLEVNIGGTENVLKVAQESGVQRVLFTSSSEVYGRTEVIPTPEDSQSTFSPSTGVRWCYATSKLVDEHMCLAFSRETGLDTIILRLFNAYGPRQVSSEYGQVVGIFARQLLKGEPMTIYGDGQQTRSFTYVGDIVDGIVKAASAETASGDVFNIGSEDEITIDDLAEVMSGLVGMSQDVDRIHAGIFKDEPLRRCPSIRKAKLAFGYEPKVDLASGLIKTIDWFKERMDLVCSKSV